MFHFDPKAYGPVLAALLDTDRRRPLDAGRPDSDARAALKKLTPTSAFTHTASKLAKGQPVDADMADCCIAAMWLLYDFLDESHTISQGIETPTGSFLHAIMHRREGDFWNSKYWFRRVGEHPALDDLPQRAEKLAAERGQERVIKKLTAGGRWDPLAFVDLCVSNVSASSDPHELCLELQQAEWELLFDHCYCKAVGA